MEKNICRFAFPAAITAGLARDAVPADADRATIYAAARARLREIINAAVRDEEIPTVGDGPELIDRIPRTRIWITLSEAEIAALGGDCERARDTLRELVQYATGVDWPAVGRPRVHPAAPADLSQSQERYLGRLLMSGMDRDEAIAKAREYTPRPYRRRKGRARR